MRCLRLRLRVREAVLVFPRASAQLVRANLPKDAYVVAIDAGAETLRALGVRPDLLVGDMDSVSPETLAALEAEGVRIERHPTAKRDTDAALAYAHVQDAERVLFLGPGGGRADHALANLHLLVAADGKARAVDADARTWIVTPTRPLALDLPIGALLSILPFDQVATGIAYEGLAYPLHDATMHPGDPYGISNVAAAPTQRIALRAGRLVVIQPLA